MTVLKSELYQLIESKKSELYEEYRAQERQIKTDAINAFYENAELNETLELFVTQLQAIKKTAAILESNIPSYYTAHHDIDRIDWYDDVEDLKTRMFQEVTWSRVERATTPAVKEQFSFNEQIWRDRQKEFERLGATLKANSPTKGYKLLKELGFDVSHLDPSRKPKSSVPIVMDFDITKLGVGK
ncbi:gp37 [Listeria phage P35]|uniref:gp37 n=1 Tax=Listeria phage P35 TaxID=330398 RepID=UPI00015C0233|nr:gp37 [Listeria phage P35]AAY53222.1 gp37 [Listeria phage P35]